MLTLYLVSLAAKNELALAGALAGHKLGGMVVMPQTSSDGSTEVNEDLLDEVEKEIKARTLMLVSDGGEIMSDQSLRNMREYESAIKYLGKKAELLRHELAMVYNCVEGNSVEASPWWVNTRVEGKRLDCPGRLVRRMLTDSNSDPAATREMVIHAIPSLPDVRPRDDLRTHTFSLVPELNRDELSDPHAVIRLLDQRLSGFDEDLQNAIISEATKLPWLQQDQEHMLAWFERSGQRNSQIDLKSGAVMRDVYLLGAVSSMLMEFLRYTVGDVHMMHQKAAGADSQALVAGRAGDDVARDMESVIALLRRLHNEMYEALHGVEDTATLLHWGKLQRRPDLGARLTNPSQNELDLRRRSSSRRSSHADHHDGDDQSLFLTVAVAMFIVLASLVVACRERLTRFVAGEPTPGAPEEGQRRRRGRDVRGQGRGGGRGGGGGGGGGRGRGRGRGNTNAATPPEPAVGAQPTSSAEPTNEPTWWLELREWWAELERAAQSERDTFMCSISGEIMRNPVILSGGAESNTYEHDSIAEWLAGGNMTDPLSREVIPRDRYNLVPDRRLQREIRAWCEAKVASFRQQVSTRPAAQPAPRTGIHVFVDYSNVLLGARHASRDLDVERLISFIEGGREARQRFVAGSQTAEQARAVWERRGYTVATDPRSGQERFVDEALHSSIMDAVSRSFADGRVLVLVSGDGNANSGRTTFPECVNLALRNDWHVELFAWRGSTSGVYTRFEREYPGAFRVRQLDEMP